MGPPQVDAGGPSFKRDAEELEAIIARPREGGRRVSEIKNELGDTMNRHAAVFRDVEGLNTALETINPPPARRPRKA